MNNLIEKRFSPYDFDASYELDENQIQELFEAARWAPSSYNEQPWKFHYATRQNKEGFKKLYEVILDSNKPWSGDVSILILGTANTVFKRNGKTNRHAFYDLGQSVQSMILQATEMGLHAHQMGGYSVEKARAAFDLPENVEPVVMIAIGKRIGTDVPDRSRKDVKEIFVEA